MCVCVLHYQLLKWRVFVLFIRWFLCLPARGRVSQFRTSHVSLFWHSDEIRFSLLIFLKLFFRGGRAVSRCLCLWWRAFYFFIFNLRLQSIMPRNWQLLTEFNFARTGSGIARRPGRAASRGVTVSHRVSITLSGGGGPANSHWVNYQQ